MTREELKEMTYEDILEYIHDFESRTCENCKYYIFDKYYYYCNNDLCYDNGMNDVREVEKDFGCNKFERKDT